MSSSSVSGASPLRLLRAGSALATSWVLIALSLAGCTPGSTAEGSPTPAEQSSASPSEKATPTAAEDGAPVRSSDSPTQGSEAGSSPDDPGAAEGNGGTDGGEQGTDGAGAKDTTDWSEPADPTVEGPTAAPVLPEVEGRIGDEIVLPTEVIVDLSAVTTTTLTAETPGEQSGPAVVVEVQITNRSEEPQPVGSATVSLSVEGGEIGVPTWALPNDPLQGEVPAGGTAVGTYVFMLDPAGQRPVTVRVNYSAGEPVATFTGTTP